MDSVKNDGGPAFPQLHAIAAGDLARADTIPGMSLRDYLACRAPAPDPTDMCDLMGWDRDLKMGDGEDEFEDTITNRWHALPQDVRLNCLARHAYLWADAMIKARA